MKTRQMLPLLILVTISLYAAANDDTLIISQNVRRTCMAKITKQIAKPSTSTEKILRLEQMYKHHLDNLEPNEENKAFIQKNTLELRNAIIDRNAIIERNKSLKKNIKNSLKIIKNNPDQKDTLRQEIIETLPKLSPCDETDDFLHGFYRKFDRTFGLKTVPYLLEKPLIDPITTLIEQEQKGISCLFYQFSYEQLADALINVCKKNIPVNLVVDEQCIKNKKAHNLLKNLSIEGISISIIYPNKGDSRYKMHAKGILFEHNSDRARSLLVTGSANATVQGFSNVENKNDEIMICNDDPHLIRTFITSYKEITKENALPLLLPDNDGANKE